MPSDGRDAGLVEGGGGGEMATVAVTGANPVREARNWRLAVPAGVTWRWRRPLPVTIEPPPALAPLIAILAPETNLPPESRARMGRVEARPVGTEAGLTSSVRPPV